MDLPEGLKVWLARFWWTRGVFATLALLGLILQVFDISQSELLRVLHATIIGWNAIAAQIGKLVGALPWLPNLSAAAVNALVLIAAISIPAVFAVMTAGVREWLEAFTRLADRIARAVKLDKLNDLISQRVGVVRPYVYQANAISRFAWVLRAYAVFVIVIFSLLIFLRATFDNSITVDEVYYIAGFFLLAMLFLPAYRRGVILVTSAIATIEVLYLAQAPFVEAAIDRVIAWSCDVTADSSEACVRATEPDVPVQP